jgi:hypothetical protein
MAMSSLYDELSAEELKDLSPKRLSVCQLYVQSVDCS